MSAHHPHASAAIHLSDSAPRTVADAVENGGRPERGQPAPKLPGILAGPGPRAASLEVRRLASLVDDVVSSLDAPGGDEPLHAVVARCNAALESSLEAQREQAVEARRDPGSAARDELRRLAALLISVDRTDAALIMRQIRRVLGRFDGRCGG